METKFTEQQSLTLISEMIEQARNNFQKGSGNSMIFNGILVAFVAMLNVVLALVFVKSGINTGFSFWAWTLMIPGSFVSYLIKRKIDREAMVKTHIDTIIGTTWKGFTYAACVLLAVIFGMGFGLKFYVVFCLINPVILTMTGLAEFITAKACRFKPYLYGALIMWLGALACTAAMWTSEPVIVQFFILAVCMIAGFVIPGYQLNKKAKDHV